MGVSRSVALTKTREQLIHLLTEAAELEHNLLCSYIYAAASLKKPKDGLSGPMAEAAARWRSAIMSIAVEEMTHLTLVNNLLVAIGGAARFDRPNFPVAEGYHPARIVIRLERFNRSTLQHFIFLERPPDSDVVESPDYLPKMEYARTSVVSGVAPGTLDYDTVGEFYANIRQLICDLSEDLGSELFVNPSGDRQIGPALVNLPGVRIIRDRATALAAVNTIVDQGEGASRNDEHSHFSRFRGIQDEWRSTGLKDFDPAFPAATSPALRKPVGDAVHRVWITNPQAADILDVANAGYGLMLNCLEQAYSPLLDATRKPFIEAALHLMKAIIALSEQLARLPAGPDHPGVCAGMSFMTPRNLGPRDPRFATKLLREKALILKNEGSRAADVDRFLSQVVETLV
jgi:hypothetical protein